MENLAVNQSKVAQYKQDWSKITPVTDEDIFNRYVFSFLSVHTSWSTNVRSYLLLMQNKKAFSNKQELANLIRLGGAQYYNTKAEGIFRFNKDFYANPNQFKLTQERNGPDIRNTIMQKCYGLGFAKTAFALEMCFPLLNQSVCLDTHMLQLYGYEDATQRGKIGSKKSVYLELETHWLSKCKQLGIPPTIARAIWWDEKQQKPNSNYWTHALTNNE